MKKTDPKGWNSNESKDTFWNLSVLIGGFLVLMAGAVDLSKEPPNYVADAAYQQTTTAQ